MQNFQVPITSKIMLLVSEMKKKNVCGSDVSKMPELEASPLLSPGTHGFNNNTLKNASVKKPEIR